MNRKRRSGYLRYLKYHLTTGITPVMILLSMIVLMFVIFSGG